MLCSRRRRPCRALREVLVLNGDVPLLSDALVRRTADHPCQVAGGRYGGHHPSGGPHGVRPGPSGPARRVPRHRRRSGGDGCASAREGDQRRHLLFQRAPVFAALHKVRPSAVKGELYFPEVLPILLKARGRIATVLAEDAQEVLGINTRAELAEAYGVLRRRVVDRLMEAGVTCLDPATTHVSVLATVGRDTVLYPQVQLEGTTRIGEGCTVHAGSRIRDSQLGNRVTVLDGCVILEAEIADECIIGPYAHLRPGNRLRRKVKIGNFVEVKKSVVGEGSKVPHLTYVGDSTVGERVNVGAGTITCNYDGFGKHQTIIEDEAFIGSNSCLVAPVRIGRGAIRGRRLHHHAGGPSGCAGLRSGAAGEQGGAGRRHPGEPRRSADGRDDSDSDLRQRRRDIRCACRISLSVHRHGLCGSGVWTTDRGPRAKGR